MCNVLVVLICKCIYIPRTKFSQILYKMTFLVVRESGWGRILLNAVVGLTGDSDTGNPTVNASA